MVKYSKQDIYRILGEGITTDTQLENFIKHTRLNKYFDKIYSLPTFRRSKLRNNKFAILNDKKHWYTVYKKGGKYYEFDSFNRDLMGPSYQDSKTNHPQSLLETNCGQRTIEHLFETF